MAGLKTHLYPYYLDVALAEDSASDSDCLVLDVGRNDKGESVTSLKHLTHKINDFLINAYVLAHTATKLYVVGRWNLELQDETTMCALEDESYNLELRKQTAEEREWHEAAHNVSKLISSMVALKELTWISELPFMPYIWTALPTSLTKLVLDLGQPVRLHQDGDVQHKSYVSTSEMKPLLQQTKLKELRLLRLHDSFQCIAWETVFRNTSQHGMKVLDLQMAAAPLIRSENWRQAKDVVGLTVPAEDMNGKEYKGLEGKGILHYSVGTGEYLDDFCMRKARIASGLDEAIPIPLWCLKLDGFVIDHLPFGHELSRIVLLACGSNCVDAGMRAPTTSRAPRNKWSKAVNNAATHCVVQWPCWIGVFDDRGEQRDTSGNVVSQEAGLSTALDEHALTSPLSLTEEHLNLKAMKEALDDLTNEDYFYGSPVPSRLIVPQPSPCAVSNLSFRGSDIPTSTKDCVPALDGSTMDDLFPPSYSSVMSINGFGDSGSHLSTDEESFEKISPSTTNNTSELAKLQQNGLPNVDVKPHGIKHKVRRSLGWLSGSS